MPCRVRASRATLAIAIVAGYMVGWLGCGAGGVVILIGVRTWGRGRWEGLCQLSHGVEGWDGMIWECVGFVS
jgi:hypothetical protein